MGGFQREGFGRFSQKVAGGAVGVEPLKCGLFPCGGVCVGLASLTRAGGSAGSGRCHALGRRSWPRLGRGVLGEPPMACHIGHISPSDIILGHYPKFTNMRIRSTPSSQKLSTKEQCGRRRQSSQTYLKIVTRVCVLVALKSRL